MKKFLQLSILLASTGGIIGKNTLDPFLKINLDGLSRLGITKGKDLAALSFAVAGICVANYDTDKSYLKESLKWWLPGIILKNAISEGLIDAKDNKLIKDIMKAIISYAVVGRIIDGIDSVETNVNTNSKNVTVVASNEDASTKTPVVEELTLDSLEEAPATPNISASARSWLGWK